MAECFLGEIRIFAGNYAPRDWAFCDGQLLSITSYSALYSLLGVYYGGDGLVSFGLPDFRGRVAMGMGSGPGLSDRYLGSRFGLESVHLTESQMPRHTHTMQASDNTGDSTVPVDNVVGHGSENQCYYKDEPNPSQIVEFQPGTVRDTGGGEDHPNMMPGLCLNYIIALKGIYPPRS